MRNMINSIRFKLLVIPLILVLIGIGIIAYFTSTVIEDSLVQEMERNGYATSEDFVDQIDATSADLAALQASLERMATRDGVAYAMFIDSNLETVAHSDKSLLGIKFDDPGTKAAVIEGVSFSDQWYNEEEGIEVLYIMHPAVINGERVGAISIGYSMERTNAAIARNIRAVSLSSIFAILIIAGTLFATSNYAISVVGQVGGHMDLLATGDFSLAVPEELLSKKDEFGTIARSAHRMQESIVGAVKSILHASEQLASSSEELTATSEQSAIAANEVAKVIEEIANGSSEQARATGTGASSVRELGTVVTENKEDLETLNLTTMRAEELKDEGMDILRTLIESTELNTNFSAEVQSVIFETNDSAQKIVSASEMIRSIADQTNLLALNASIEAARAGEAGRGFAVVADAIKTLATQSTEFTQEISVIINELTQKTASAVATMEEVGEITSSQSDSVSLTNDRFVGIADAIDAIKGVFENVDHSSDIMSDKNEQIISVIEKLSAISQENAAGTQQASASVEEQSATVEEIANASEELAKLAQDLNAEMAYFKV